MKAASVIGLIVLALISLCIAPCVPHSLRQARLERQFRELPHPPSRALAYESDVGLLEGNGNHCDYFVGELRASTLTLPELQQAYDPRVDVQDIGVPDSVFTPRERLWAAAARQTLAPGERMYLVSLVDQEGAGLDFRCH